MWARQNGPYGAHLGGPCLARMDCPCGPHTGQPAPSPYKTMIFNGLPGYHYGLNLGCIDIYVGLTWAQPGLPRYFYGLNLGCLDIFMGLTWAQPGLPRDFYGLNLGCLDICMDLTWATQPLPVCSPCVARVFLLALPMPLIPVLVLSRNRISFS